METLKNKLKCYNQIKQVLELNGCTVGAYKEISYGLQFNIEANGKRGLFRIFEGKKGIRFDLSQIRDEYVLKLVQGVLEEGEDCVVNSDEQGKVRTNLKDSETVVSGKEDKDPEELIGIDESGKGDYFGPLVVAGVYVNPEYAKLLKNMGVDDSKKLSDKKIKSIALKIKELCPHNIVIINNTKYNELYQKIGNLNELLAWGHARVLENLLGKVDCGYALSDQFGNPALIERALMEKGRGVKLSQRPKAEENIAVAAASILARSVFVERVKAIQEKYNLEFPKGASTKVVEAGKHFVSRYGEGALEDVAKLHFKITDKII